MWDLGISAAVYPLREAGWGESERAVLAGDHGFLNATLGEGERGELTADHGLLKATEGDGDDNWYRSSQLASVEDSLAESAAFLGFGMIFL